MAKVKTREMTSDPLAAEEQAFYRKRAQLLDQYEGQFVVLYRGRVIGHGVDDEQLAQRMFEKLGDVPFYIVRVEKEPTVYDVPSPEVVG
jgi:hypothetical protein